MTTFEELYNPPPLGIMTRKLIFGGDTGQVRSRSSKRQTWPGIRSTEMANVNLLGLRSGLDPALLPGDIPKITTILSKALGISVCDSYDYRQKTRHSPRHNY